MKKNTNNEAAKKTELKKILEKIRKGNQSHEDILESWKDPTELFHSKEDVVDEVKYKDIILKKKEFRNRSFTVSDLITSVSNITGVARLYSGLVATNPWVRFNVQFRVCHGGGFPGFLYETEYELLRQGVYPFEVFSYHISGTPVYQFIVVGRREGKTSDPKTWNKEAVVMDGFLNICAYKDDYFSNEKFVKWISRPGFSDTELRLEETFTEKHKGYLLNKFAPIINTLSNYVFMELKYNPLFKEGIENGIKRYYLNDPNYEHKKGGLLQTHFKDKQSLNDALKKEIKDNFRRILYFEIVDKEPDWKFNFAESNIKVWAEFDKKFELEKIANYFKEFEMNVKIVGKKDDPNVNILYFEHFSLLTLETIVPINEVFELFNVSANKKNNNNSNKDVNNNSINSDDEEVFEEAFSNLSPGDTKRILKNELNKFFDSLRTIVEGYVDKNIDWLHFYDEKALTDNFFLEVGANKKVEAMNLIEHFREYSISAYLKKNPMTKSYVVYLENPLLLNLEKVPPICKINNVDEKVNKQMPRTK